MFLWSLLNVFTCPFAVVNINSWCSVRKKETEYPKAVFVFTYCKYTFRISSHYAEIVFYRVNFERSLSCLLFEILDRLVCWWAGYQLKQKTDDLRFKQQLTVDSGVPVKESVGPQSCFMVSLWAICFLLNACRF